ncbi:MAG: YkvA family protein [Candidatus Limnocylindria bacterium]
MDWRILGGIALSLIGAWALFVALLWFIRPRGMRLVELVRIVPDVLRLVRDLLADRTVPLSARLALIGLLAWLISPVDLIPEFIPVLGPVDDVVVAVLVLRYVRRKVGLAELRRRWPGSAEGFELLSGILGST